MRSFDVVRGPDGYAVVLSEVPWWAYAASQAVDRLDGALGHVLCGHFRWFFTWALFLDLEHSRELRRLPVSEGGAEALGFPIHEDDDSSDS